MNIKAIFESGCLYGDVRWRPFGQPYTIIIATAGCVRDCLARRPVDYSIAGVIADLFQRGVERVVGAPAGQNKDRP
jgi:hypothetical protein